MVYLAINIELNNDNLNKYNILNTYFKSEELRSIVQQCSVDPVKRSPNCIKVYIISERVNIQDFARY